MFWAPKHTLFAPKHADPWNMSNMYVWWLYIHGSILEIFGEKPLKPGLGFGIGFCSVWVWQYHNSLSHLASIHTLLQSHLTILMDVLSNLIPPGIIVTKPAIQQLRAADSIDRGARTPLGHWGNGKEIQKSIRIVWYNPQSNVPPTKTFLWITSPNFNTEYTMDWS